MGLALVLSLAALPTGAAPPSSPSKPTAPATLSASTTRITLITGDHVAVTATKGRPEQVRFEPGRGSGSATASTSFTAGHTVVIPSAAQADVDSGRLDRDLFDVTTLVAEHRDDAHSKTLPVIIRYSGTPAAATSRAKQTAVPGAAQSRVLSSIGARAAAITKTSAANFWDSLTPGRTDRVATTVAHIGLDRQFKASLDQSVPQIGGPAAWQRGLTGKGVKLAILDTGLDTGENPTHADFTGVRRRRSPRYRCGSRAIGSSAN